MFHLIEHFIVDQIAYNESARIVDYRQFCSRWIQIQASHRRHYGCHQHRQRIIQKYSPHLTILQTEQKSLFSRRPTRHLDVPNKTVQEPFALHHTGEIEALQFLLLAQHQMLGAHHQQTAIEFLANFLLHFVVHRLIFGRTQFVQNHTLRQLNGQTISIDGNFVDQIAALDSHLLPRHQMLNNNVAHILTKCVSFAIQSVHCVEGQIVCGQCAVLTADNLWSERKKFLAR